MDTLYFTAGETKAFASLSSAIKGAWKIEQETLTYDDTQARREFRFQMMRVHDRQLVQFREKVSGTKTEKEFLELVKTVDLKKVDSKEIAHIVFAMGPEAMNVIIQGILSEATTSEDLELAAAFAALRHGMLESFQEVSRRS